MNAPPDFLAVKMTHLTLASRRLAKVRGIIRADAGEETDAATKTNAEPEASSAGEVRVIPIRGVLCRDCRGWFPWLTDTEEVEELVREAESDANVAAILLDIDSPGGTANGSIELGDTVAACAKPIVSYSAGMCDSGAYWVAAGSALILARKTASIGSIGALRALDDLSLMYAMLGVSVDLFVSGEHKGAGYPGTSLTDEQKSLFQSRVDDLGMKFKTHVLNHRPLVPFEAMEGQDFYADKAMNLGLVDGLVVDIASAIETAQALA